VNQYNQYANTKDEESDRTSEPRVRTLNVVLCVSASQVLLNSVGPLSLDELGNTRIDAVSLWTKGRVSLALECVQLYTSRFRWSELSAYNVNSQ